MRPGGGLRDRATLVPEAARQRQVWGATGNPGAVLAGGRFVGKWRPEKRGRRLTLAVTLFEPVSSHVRSEIEAEAATLAPFRDGDSVAVRYLA